MRKPRLKIILSLAIFVALISAQFILPLQVSAAPGDPTPTGVSSVGGGSSSTTPPFSVPTNGLIPTAAPSLTPVTTGSASANSNTGLNYNSPNQSGNPLKISLSVLPGLLTQVVSCTGVINDAAVGLGQLQAKITSFLNLKNLLDKPVQTQDGNLATQQSFTKCLDGIAVQLSKTFLSKMTGNAMTWINKGFNGNPLYVQDADSFLNSINNQILQKEVDLFKSPGSDTAYPYGRGFAQGAIMGNQAQNSFQSSMQQDLTNYLTPGSTPQSFATDFSQGGWDGWLALTMHEQNNPLGFNMVETNHLAATQNNAVQNIKDQLAQGQGYLPQQNCVEWQRVDSSGNLLYMTNGQPLTTDTAPPIINGSQMGKCVKSQTVTPGSSIKAKIDTYINTPERQLELVKTMDDALNALFSALMGKFEQQGLASLTPSSSNFITPADGGFGVNQVIGADGSVLNSVDLTSNSGSSTGDGYFDLTKDLGNTYNITSDGTLVIANKGVLQTQYDYVNDINKSKNISNNVMPALGALDYCIPGPNPNWQTITQNSIVQGATTGDQITFDNSSSKYSTEVNGLYGPNSPMQDSTPGNTSYLQMSQAGLALTADMDTDANQISSAESGFASAISVTNADIAKLNTIKDQVNTIIATAQARRASARAQAGLPAMPALCVSTEKVTYLDNGVLK